MTIAGLRSNEIAKQLHNKKDFAKLDGISFPRAPEFTIPTDMSRKRGVGPGSQGAAVAASPIDVSRDVARALRDYGALMRGWAANGAVCPPDKAELSTDNALSSEKSTQTK